MEPQCRDETRWLARLIAVYIFIFVVNGLAANVSVFFNAPTDDSVHQVRAAMGLVLGIVFVWLGFRLFICSSLWGLLNFPGNGPLFTYLQCRYFLMNQHVRSGLIGSAIMLLTAWPLPLMLHVFKDTWFFPVPEIVRDILFWPVKTFFEVSGFQSDSRVLLFAMLMIYFVGTGFIAGGGLSLLFNHISLKRLEGGKPKSLTGREKSNRLDNIS